ATACERRPHAFRLRALGREARHHVRHYGVGADLPSAGDVFAREASVQLRFGSLLEELHTQDLSEVHPDDRLAWQAPNALVDRVDTTVPVASSDDGDRIGGALEHLSRQVLRALARGDVDDRP